MNRLGLTVEQALAFRDRNGVEHAVSPILIMSHLACAGSRTHPMNEEQRPAFDAELARPGSSVSSVRDGLVREVEFLEPLNMAILSERRVFAPYGLEGGEAVLEDPSQPPLLQIQ